MPKRAPAPPSAYVVRDPYSVVRGPWLGKWLVVGDTFYGVRALGRQVHMDGVTLGVVHRTILEHDLRHYQKLDDIPLQSAIAGLKEEMLAHGATPLAVQWMGDLAPFSDKELNIMAGKLKTTPAKATKATKATKAAAAEAPVKPVKAAKAGNPEALEKARAARAGKTAEYDKQKITIATEKKANPYREGTKAHATFELFKQHKTVGEVKAAATDDHDIGYLRYASRDGHITLS